MPADPSALELPEIQGIVLRGYRFPRVRYFVLSVASAPAARAALAALTATTDEAGPVEMPRITTAEPWSTGASPNYCLNVGITWPGLLALDVGVTDACFASFRSFRAGAAARADVLGDVGASAPERWIAGLGSGRDHVILALFALEPDGLELHSGRLRALFAQGPAFSELAAFDGGALPGGTVHFGYRDGISQPTVIGARERPLPDAQPPVAAWNFVLQDDPDASYNLPAPEVLGRNGSFGVFRILRQDVVGFEQFLRSNEGSIDKELLAAKICGRWRTGVPLAVSPDSPNAGIPDGDYARFDYAPTELAPGATPDPRGVRCPLGAHMRRANPRSTSVAGGGGQLHRIIRRGMPYGPPYDPSQPYDGVERGLAGFFINASIENQYEFVVNRWMNEGGFAAGLAEDDKDPLGGDNDPATSRFEIPRAGQAPLVLTGFGRFVDTRGGAYCFFPSIAALKYIGTR
jgi:deferrochelatase/peroxidase EfeB